jgi:flagellar biosynthesis chaperone FliJ
MNLFNQLQNRGGSSSSSKAMELFGVKRFAFTPQTKLEASLKSSEISTHKIDDSNNEVNKIVSEANSNNEVIIENIEHRLKIELAHSAALDTLVTSVQRLQQQIPTLDNPTKLADVAAKMSKIVEFLGDRKETTKEEQVHYHFYMPEQNKIEQYEVIEVS